MEYSTELQEEAMKSSQEEGGEGSSVATSSGESRRSGIQRCIASLVHACQCRDAKCRLPSCHKMKRVVTHAKKCKRKGAGTTGAGSAPSGTPGCPICKQLIALCCYHAKNCTQHCTKHCTQHCTQAKCIVPYCANIKQKLKQQRFQQQAILRRRFANMQLQNSMSAAIIPESTTTPSSSELFGTSAHMKPVVTPPPGALQAVQQVHAAVLRQQQRPFGQQDVGLQGQGMDILPGMMQQMQGQRMQGCPQGPMGNVLPSTGQPMLQVLQQLLAVLQSPKSPAQQEQVRNILKSNPALVAAIIRQRSQQNQGGGGGGGPGGQRVMPGGPGQQGGPNQGPMMGQPVQQQMQGQGPGQMGNPRFGQMNQHGVIGQQQQQGMVGQDPTEMYQGGTSDFPGQGPFGQGQNQQQQQQINLSELLSNLVEKLSRLSLFPDTELQYN